MAQFRLTSAPMVHTPGIVKWARAAGEDGARVLRAAFPSLPESGIKKLLEGHYTVGGDTVVVEVEDTLEEIIDLRIYKAIMEHVDFSELLVTGLVEFDAIDNLIRSNSSALSKVLVSMLKTPRGRLSVVEGK